MMINDPYTDTKNCVDRLYQQYKEHGCLLIAVDFDDTLYDFFKKGYNYPRVINLLKQCEELDFKIILFTSSTLKRIISFVLPYLNEQLNIKVDYINESPVMNETKKPYYNLLLDDKAGLGQACEILEKIIKKIWKKKIYN